MNFTDKYKSIFFATAQRVILINGNFLIGSKLNF